MNTQIGKIEFGLTLVTIALALFKLSTVWNISWVAVLSPIWGTYFIIFTLALLIPIFTKGQVEIK